jgi:hypothetical protein
MVAVRRPYLLDLGSHSVKLYRSGDGPLRLLRTVTWRVLERPVGPEQLEAVLTSVLADVDDVRSVQAVATAAFRQDTRLGDALTTVCDHVGLSLQIIDQGSEAHLLRLAVSSSASVSGLDAINVGGGSVQILSSDGREHPLSFGVSDLNRQFALTDAPDLRRVDECRAFVMRQLPPWLGLFSYTGGERTYLEHFGVPVTGGWCSRADFTTFAEDMAGWSEADLRARSPYDEEWMSGAVASNCIVLACLGRNDLDKFVPTDLNISHGVHDSLAPASDDAVTAAAVAEHRDER